MIEKTGYLTFHTILLLVHGYVVFINQAHFLYFVSVVLLFDWWPQSFLIGGCNTFWNIFILLHKTNLNAVFCVKLTHKCDTAT